MRLRTVGAVVLLWLWWGLLVCQPAGAADRLVDIRVVNAEVRDVLSALAAVGGVSLVADDSVAGHITAEFNGVRFSDALDTVARAKGLAYQVVNGVIIIGKPEIMVKNFGSLHVFKLRYIRAADLPAVLTAVLDGDNGQAAGRLKAGSGNTLVFYGLPAEAARLAKALTELDVPGRQISLEAQVVALNKNAVKNIGVDWRWADIPQLPAITRDKDSETSERQLPGSIRFGRNPEGRSYEFQYQGKISALVSRGEAKMLSRPKVTTTDGHEARIMIGDRIPVLKETVNGGVTTTSIEYVDAGIKLIYTPRINGDGTLTADVRTEVSTPTLVPEMKAYRITTREAETNVRVKDGETMIIGGLIGSDESGGVNRIPLLGDLPVLGRLFSSSNRTKQETEIVIFLTAHIVN